MKAFFPWKTTACAGLNEWKRRLIGRESSEENRALSYHWSLEKVAPFLMKKTSFFAIIYVYNVLKWPMVGFTFGVCCFSFWNHMTMTWRRCRVRSSCCCCCCYCSWSRAKEDRIKRGNNRLTDWLTTLFPFFLSFFNSKRWFLSFCFLLYGLYSPDFLTVLPLDC
jgi:hypothetical protein